MADSDLSPYEIALAVFEDIQARFPSLEMALDLSPTNPMLDLSLDIPCQRNLSPDVSLYLQGRDDLTFAVGTFFCSEWFPCTDGAVVAKFRDAVCGYLEGRHRIVELSRRDGLPVSAALEAKENGDWKRLYTHTSLRALWPWPRPVTRIIQRT